MTQPDSEQPLVSVIIPTHNRPTLLHTALASVLQQSYSQLEIVVIDDGSEPPVRLAEPIDPRIKLIRQDRSMGAAAARNLGMRHAQGQFFAFLDDDDAYFPHKLALQVPYLLAHPEVDMVFSRVEYHYGNGQKECHNNGYNGWLANFIHLNTIHTNASLFRPRILSCIQFDERLRKYDDMQFYLAASLHCTIHYLPDIVALWNMDNRPDQLTHKGHYCRNYRNFRYVCENFESVIDQHAILRKRFYLRLFAYAVLCFRPIAAVRLLFKLIGVGRLPR
jgi:glycosyltransferase involved in cell wall biosynthesis